MFITGHRDRVVCRIQDDKAAHPEKAGTPLMVERVTTIKAVIIIVLITIQANLIKITETRVHDPAAL